jgi:glutamate-1-semialdehyde 2,1-aminomutase
MSAGIATLEFLLGRPELWDELAARTDRLAGGILEAAHRAGIPLTGHRVGTMFSVFFTETTVKDWPTAKTSDTVLFGNYFRGMLERGIYLAPSQFEAGFMSAVHDDTVIEATLNAAAEVLEILRKSE